VLSLCSAHSHPLNYGVELLLGLMGMIMSVRLLDSKAGQLLAIRGKLSHLPMSGSELLGQPLTQSRLLGKAVPNILLAAKK
jgi:hypothetical protein